MRQALELSTTTAPAAAAMGPYSLLILPPAENRAISTPSKESLVKTSTGISLPRKVTFLPKDRSEASGHQPMHRKPALLQTSHHLLPYRAGGPYYCDCICSTHDLKISWDLSYQLLASRPSQRKLFLIKAES